ncbi:MipA/OmpV family protein [uncultured Duodenibacillus sp.]|nr:MipA/OmpV family protein [uncultured Duodenibacillus sp.]
MKFLSSEVKDSPMTEGKSAAWTVGSGVMYHFD